MLKRLLLCIDGEDHTDKAVKYALDISKATGANLAVLHVIDGFLLEKRISHEIYAVGRNEYRAYVKKELQKLADKYLAAFKEMAEKAGVKFETVLRSGHPVEEVLKEIKEKEYDLVILGGKGDQGLWELKSRNLPLKVFRKSKASIMVVR
jgi:nucleotide-binding universal stress UspA family protein